MLEIFKTLARSVFGMNHVANHENQYLEIVGNGLDAEHPRNARTLDIAGNEVLAGRLTVGAQPEGDNDVATKKYVDDNAGSGGGSALMVTITESDNVYSLNKNYTEIKEAMESGSLVIATYAGPDGTTYTLVTDYVHNSAIPEDEVPDYYGVNVAHDTYYSDSATGVLTYSDGGGMS